MKHNSNTMKDVLEYIEKRIESEEWTKNYHSEKIQKATNAIEVWKEKVGISNEIDESLIKHLRKDVDYHKERLKSCLFELDILYTSRDAKHDKYHQTIAAR